MKKTVFITGTNSGFGYETVLYFHKKGWNVIATMRKKKNIFPKEVTVLEMDLENHQSITQAVKQAVKKYKTIDVLINNAGYGISGVFEETALDHIQKNMDVNYTGTIKVTQELYSIFLQQGFGRIITVTSVAGRIGLSLMSAYNASKFALEGFFEGLSYEAREKNIHIKLLEPGYFRTKFVKNVDWASEKEQSIFNKKNTSLHKGGNPKIVAKKLFALSTNTSFKLRYSIGIDAKAGLFLKNILGGKVFQEIMGMYSFPKKNLRKEFKRSKNLTFLEGEYQGVFSWRCSFLQLMLRFFSWKGKRFYENKTADALIMKRMTWRIGKATVQASSFRGRPTIAMKYKFLPIVDHFRKVNEQEIIGVMTIFSIPVYYFMLRKVR